MLRQLSFRLNQKFQTVTTPEWPMTGRNAYSLAWGRQRWSWCIPRGGSGVLTEILVRLIEKHGGTALTNSFPKWSPFLFQLNEQSQIMWLTVSSTRRYGLRPARPSVASRTTAAACHRDRWA